MIGRVLFAVLLCGIAAGLVMGLIQHVRLTPLILQAEGFEHVAHGHTAAEHADGGVVWSPSDGIERTFYTTLAAIVTSTGFALLLAGVALVMKIPLTRGNGWIWGLCGFVVFSFAPAMGLPPELPGMTAAALNGRIIWWLSCILLTTMGVLNLYYALKGKGSPWTTVALLLLPHIMRLAPYDTTTTSGLPAQLAAQFVVASLSANLVMWLVLGALLGFVLHKFESEITS